ncbi:MAG: DNA polymerase I, partial [Deltaproteobacteria bacterium]|nr:DNA polymerase I [Deltaproteobacteria bacterium]
MSSKERFLIVDGSNLLYRAFYALPRLTSSDGTPTGAVYGFVSSLQKVRNRFSPRYLCVVFDAPGPTFRDELYEGYKETRQKMPEDIAAQIPIIKEIIDISGIKSVELEGVEADDVIGSLSRIAAKMDLEVVIVSSDKDLCQLVEKNVQMFDSLKDRIVKAPDVRKKFGVEPEKIVDLLALSGDQTDNIPGVPGIGNKTAAALLQEFGSVENLTKNLDFVKGKRRELLRENLENIRISKELAKIKDDVPLPFQMEDFIPKKVDESILTGTLKKLGFRTKKSAEEKTGEGVPDGIGPRRPVAFTNIPELEAGRAAFSAAKDSPAAIVPVPSDENGVV